MGLPMARNLTQAGFPVRAWNRSRDKAEPLTDDGAEICQTPAEAVRGATVILTMLADADAVVETVRDALAEQPADDSLWLQMSTIGEEGTERCQQLAQDRELEFVDAPVLGTKQPAEEGKLVVLASGPEALRDRSQAIFDALGQRTMWVGDAGAGTRLKLATNSWILAVVEGTAETFALAEGLGLDPGLVLEAVAGGPLDLPYMQMKGKAIMEHQFAPSFRLELAAKDASLVEEAARRRELDLPALQAIRQQFEKGAKDHGDEDMSAVYLSLVQGNGSG